MSSFNEWELLLVAEGIEQGDPINVEDTESGEVVEMTYVKSVGHNVYLKAKNKQVHVFCGKSLENKGDEPWIISVG